MPPQFLLPRASSLRYIAPRLPSTLRPYSKDAPSPNVLQHMGQGTPIDELMEKDPKAAKCAPEVLKSTRNPSNKREYSTFADPSSCPDRAPPSPEERVGHKYPLPELPLPSTSHLKHRYNPIVEQVTNLLMRDGKKSVAQKNMTRIFSILRTKSAPTPNPRTPLIHTAPLPSLPNDPIAYLQTAIDSLAPLVRIKAVKGSGGFKDNIPIPLGLRQRRRKAFEWILDAADKKKERMGLAERLAEEIVGVVEGRSTAWEKRNSIHKVAVAARANVKVTVAR